MLLIILLVTVLLPILLTLLTGPDNVSLYKERYNGKSIVLRCTCTYIPECRARIMVFL